jgi:integrase
MVWEVMKSIKLISKEEFVTIPSINKQLKRAKSPSTYTNWMNSLYRFFKVVDIFPDDFVKLPKNKIEDHIEAYVDYLKQNAQKEGTNTNSIPAYVNPLASFLVYNRVDGMHEAWKRIKANFPQKRRSTDGKYNELQLQKMYQFADIREKAVLALMMSGMRIGSLIGLKVKHLRPIENWGSVMVYADTVQEYNAFVTPQGYKDITDYLEYRKRNGEDIKPESPLIRNEFQPAKAGTWLDPKGKAHQPIPISTSTGCSQIVTSLVRKAGVLKNSHNIRTRHEIMTCHGFRKYVNTVCKTSGMDSERVEMLMGHSSSSLASHYWRLPTDESEMSPQELKLFQTIKSEYRKCIPELTIGELELMRIKNSVLQETVDVKLKQRDSEMMELQRQLNKMKDNPLYGMKPEDVEKLLEICHDWKTLKIQLPNGGL